MTKINNQQHVTKDGVVKKNPRIRERYIINGRRWFDRVNGNTYHTVTVERLSDRRVIYDSPITYGYDNQYFQTAYDALIQLKKVKDEDRFNHELNRKRFIVNVADVSRKRDL